MKLKTLALATLLAAGGAHAAPVLQTCAPMEVTHNGASGLSYQLKCNAGDWTLKYSGSVPAGTDSVVAKYRVQALNGDGSNFTQSREVRLPSPALLGQALLREVVALDNGDLALRDCPEFSCTMYRPLASADKLAKASITVTPEIKRLAAEAARLNAELIKRHDALAAQTKKVATLEAQVQAMATQLATSDASLAAARAEFDSAREQHNADIIGLMNASKADVLKAAETAGAKANTDLATLGTQLEDANRALAKARADLTECQAAHAAAETAKGKADAEVASRDKQVLALQAELVTTSAKLKAAQENVEAQLGALQAKQTQAASEKSADLAALRLKLEVADGKVGELSSKVATLEQSLVTATEQLAAAQKAQTDRDAVLTAATAEKDKTRVSLELALADAQATIAELTSARALQVGELEAALAGANKKLTAAQTQYDEKVAELHRMHGQMAAASGAPADTAKLGQLTQKVSELEQALSTANQSLAQAQKTVTDTSTGEAGLKAQLEKVTTERDSAAAKVAELTQVLAEMDENRIATAKGAKQVAQDMLQLLDKHQELMAEKEAADKALATAQNKAMELAAKLEAANLARDLAMQAATTAHADADAQNLKNQDLSQKLARAEEQLQAAKAERDATAAKLQATTGELAQTAAAQKSGSDDVTTLKGAAVTLARERDALQAELANQKNKLSDYESRNAEQAQDIASLKQQLAVARNSPPQGHMPTVDHSRHNK